MDAPVETRLPIPLGDLQKRLELCARYGVTCYRDGMLSLDLMSMKKPKPIDPDLLPVPEM
jgi:hypothetical protein